MRVYAFICVLLESDAFTSLVVFYYGIAGLLSLVDWFDLGWGENSVSCNNAAAPFETSLVTSFDCLSFGASLTWTELLMYVA